MESPTTLLLIRPSHIRSNEETALNNYYQQSHLQHQDFETLAHQEFNNLVDQLNVIGVNTLVYEINDDLNTPDAHFPNNWISFHENGIVALYPMFASNRRLERRNSVLTFIKQQGYSNRKIIDYSDYELKEVFLEGTGSLVLDRPNKIAYCALSARSHLLLFEQFCPCS